MVVLPVLELKVFEKRVLPNFTEDVREKVPVLLLELSVIVPEPTLRRLVLNNPIVSVFL